MVAYIWSLSQRGKQVPLPAVVIGLSLTLLLGFLLGSPLRAKPVQAPLLLAAESLKSLSGYTGVSLDTAQDEAESCSPLVESLVLQEFREAPKPSIPSDWPYGSIVSRMCTFSQFASVQYNQTASLFKAKPAFHRKQWEFVYIYNTLARGGYLSEGKTGMGFGCGIEPLPAAFAKQGARVIATDLDPGNTNAQAWAATKQHTHSIEDLNRQGICPKEQFARLASHDYQDMNHLPFDKYEGQLDFVWSSCAIEHVGSLELSKQFLVNVMRLLKPGGMSIHTTEFNLSDLETTIEEGSSIIYRKKDILEVANKLRDLGYKPAPVDFRSGCSWVDTYVDFPPYSADLHLRLRIQNITSTSIALITIK